MGAIAPSKPEPSAKAYVPPHLRNNAKVTGDVMPKKSRRSKKTSTKVDAAQNNSISVTNDESAKDTKNDSADDKLKKLRNLNKVRKLKINSYF